jgi:phosphoribosylformimino-5-aminoimidazole carboxamide ribotide isomerase
MTSRSLDGRRAIANICSEDQIIAVEVIPAIDLMGGRCVQLVGGKPETKKDFGDPVEKALEWVDAGAKRLHVIDLDATLGIGDNLETALRVKRSCGVPIQFGGGIRSLGTALTLLEELDEDDRIIIGTLAVSEYPAFETLKRLDDYSGRLIVSVDSKGGYVALKGWTEKSALTAAQVMSACADHVWGFLYTDVDVEGQMKGINPKRVKDVVGASANPVIVSGGISSPDDIQACRSAGAWGVVLGKALYEGRINLKEVV